ncbi:hypothetical protein PM10SUCC1_21200 [Propionigenium maris DSM 9537]|uniref:Prepilin-type N-terminal cleavage/methylation domain-containing protein n=1 Tax=Propionigenium maris DSM 9537 TaxID=1123000 RepID=A0A9W6GMN3_9FUSO|nr:type II secretion system protein [Propionigenium maris]GLI56606.1 hypothetical protein PM10SUCC1_21200 [Propionigenium maris DSM 9537]
MKKSGFTLIELMVVIVIIGGLAAITLPKFEDMRKEAEIAQIQANTKNIRTAIAMWEVKHGDHMFNHRSSPGNKESHIFTNDADLDSDFLKILGKDTLPNLPNYSDKHNFYVPVTNFDKFMEYHCRYGAVGWAVNQQGEIYPAVDFERYKKFNITWKSF